jgi:uncharacterized protein
MDTPGIKLHMFPLEDIMTGVGSAIEDSGGFHKTSSTEGPLLYMNL